MNFSVIIPHKGEQWMLRRCLDSIPTRPDLEVIVEDGELGAGLARNRALARATGHWLVFADSDDWFTPAMADVLDRYARVREIDMVLLGAVADDGEGHTSPLPLTRHTRWATRGGLALRMAMYANWTPWSRMVRRELAEGLQFENVPVGNDAMFVLQCTERAARVAVEPGVCYHYYQPPAGSQTRAAYNGDTYVLRQHLRLKVNDIYRRAGYPILWPVTSKVDWSTLSAEQKSELRDLLAAYRHGPVRELRARAGQLCAKIIALWWRVIDKKPLTLHAKYALTTQNK